MIFFDEQTAGKSAWNGSCDRLFSLLYPSETASEMRGRDLISSFGNWLDRWKKMEADLKCQFAVSGGGFSSLDSPPTPKHE